LISLAVLVMLCFSVRSWCTDQAHDSAIRADIIPLQIHDIPSRPAPLFELGDPFLETGPIGHGFELPTGAVWQPSLIFFGTFRSAVQSFYDGDDHVSEWANRFDLFGNLAFTPTERIVAGIGIFDDGPDFSGYTFSAPKSVIEGGDGWDEAFNFELRTLFFEGSLDELFPNLDKRDKYGLDFGIAVGRQPISFQEGMLMNDTIDAVGISKINLKPKGAANYRTTFIWGGNEINRTNLASDDDDSQLFGWFNELDFISRTVEFDVVYMYGDDETGKGMYLGLGSIQRIGDFNTAFRFLSSNPIDDQTIHNSSGLLFFSEISWTPKGTHNHVYLNGFKGINNFRSASRGPLSGGPLNRAGILFEAVGLGRYPSALSNVADDAFGGALGYQMFFDHTRKQLTLELGGRYTSNDLDQRAMGVGASYQMAVGRRSVIRVDTFALYDKERDLATAPRDDEIKFGGRIELSFSF